MHTETTFCKSAPLPYALILGTNEIASAVAIEMRRAGWVVVLSHDPFLPVIRRKMAFHDVLFGDSVVLDGVRPIVAENVLEFFNGLVARGSVTITPLQLMDLIPLRIPDLLVDARMQKYQTTPDWRHIAPLTIGLGPNFVVGKNCDAAIETKPACAGKVIHCGGAEAPDHVPQILGGVGIERFSYSSRHGLWHTVVDIGVAVFKDLVVGRLDGVPVRAPLDGVVRGVVRDGMRVQKGVKLMEIDPRGRYARWSGVDDRSRAIGKAVLKAVKNSEKRRARKSVVAN